MIIQQGIKTWRDFKCVGKKFVTMAKILTHQHNLFNELKKFYNKLHNVK